MVQYHSFVKSQLRLKYIFAQQSTTIFHIYNENIYGNIYNEII